MIADALVMQGNKFINSHDIDTLGSMALFSMEKDSNDIWHFSVEKW